MMPPRMSRRLVAPSPIGVTGRGIGWERSSDRDQRAARRARDSSRRRGDGRPGGAALLAGAGAPISLRPWTGCRSDGPGHPRAHDVPGGRGRRATRWGAWPCSPSRVKPGVELLDPSGVSLRGQLGPHATQALDGLRPGGRWIGFQIPVHARCRQLAARIRRSEWQCRADQIRAAGPVPEPLAGCRRRRRAPGSQPGWRRPPGGRAARRRPSRVHRGWRARRRAGRCRGR